MTRGLVLCTIYRERSKDREQWILQSKKKSLLPVTEDSLHMSYLILIHPLYQSIKQSGKSKASGVTQTWI